MKKYVYIFENCIRCELDEALCSLDLNSAIRIRLYKVGHGARSEEFQSNINRFVCLYRCACMILYEIDILW